MKLTISLHWNNLQLASQTFSAADDEINEIIMLLGLRRWKSHVFRLDIEGDSLFIPSDVIHVRFDIVEETPVTGNNPRGDNPSGG